MRRRLIQALFAVLLIVVVGWWTSAELSNRRQDELQHAYLVVNGSRPGALAVELKIGWWFTLNAVESGNRDAPGVE